MAKNVEYKLNVDPGNSSKTLGQMRTRLNEIHKEMEGLKVGSKRFNELTAEAKQLDTQLTKTNESMRGLTTEEMGTEINNATEGIADMATAMVVATGAGDELEKTIQNAIIVSQGLKGISETVTVAQRNWSSVMATAAKAQRAVNAAVRANPYVALASAIGVAATAIGTWIAMSEDATTKAEAQQQALTDLNKATRESTDKVAEQTSKLEGLLHRIDNAKEGTDQHKEAVKALDEQFGQHISTLKDQNGQLRRTDELRDEIVQGIWEEVRAQKAMEQVKKILNERYQRENEELNNVVSLAEEAGASQEQLRGVKEGLREEIEAGNDITDETIDKLADENNLTATQTERIRGLAKIIGKDLVDAREQDASKIDVLLDKRGKLNEQGEKEEKVTSDIIDQLNDLNTKYEAEKNALKGVGLSQEEMAEKTTEARRSMLEAQNEAIAKWMAEKKFQEASDETLQKVLATRRRVKAQLRELNKETERNNDKTVEMKLKQIDLNVALQHTREELGKLEDDLKDVNDTTEMFVNADSQRYLDLKDSIEETKKSASGFGKISSEVAAQWAVNNEKTAQEFKEQKQTLDEAAGVAGQAVKNTFDSIMAQQQKQIDRQKERSIEAANEEASSRMAILKNQLRKEEISEQEFAKKKAQIERNKRLKEYQAKKKAWKKEQQMSITEALINGSLAVTQALASTPPPASYVLAAANAAKTAIEVATIKSQSPPPPPQFEKGGLIGGRRHAQGGTMVEAEEGEIILNRNVSKSPELTQLASSINESTGGDSFEGGGNAQSSEMKSQSEPAPTRAVVVEKDITQKQKKQKRRERRAKL